MNTGCIVYFPESCCSCIFRKTTRSLTYFLVNFKQDQTLEMLKTNDCSSLVHNICEKTTNKVTQEEIKYSITFLLCTRDLNKVERQNILKRHKSLQQKTHITTKRRNCYAQLGSLKRKKCLDNFQQYYKDNRLHIRSVSAQKYKSMDQDEKDNLLGKYKEKYKSKDPDETHNLLAKCKEKYQSMDKDQKHNLLAKCKEKYQSIDKDQKHNFLGACKEKY